MSTQSVTSSSEVTRPTRLLAGLLFGALAASSGIYLTKQRRRGARNTSASRRPRNKRTTTPKEDHDHDNVDQTSEAGPSAPSKATIHRPGVVRGVQGLIGNTPLMRIESLSKLTGCEILVSSTVDHIREFADSHHNASHDTYLPAHSQGKCEFLNPAGSPKDRVALQILLDAEADSLISPHVGDCVFEGTVGSTGISLATLCRAKGYRCSIVLPDDVAAEKSQLLEKLGAQVKKVRPRGIVDKRHFVNEARALAAAFGGAEDEEVQTQLVDDDASALFVQQRASSTGGDFRRRPRGFFADQFETSSNFKAHYNGTGPEIWAQCGAASLDEVGVGDQTHYPQLDIFVAGAGTGGTLSGVAAALRDREAALRRKSKNREDAAGVFAVTSSLWRKLSSWTHASPAPNTIQSTPPPIRIVLADPQGSGLFNKVKHGVLYSSTEAEGTRRRHQVDTIVEGIGMNRVTKNLSFGIEMVDDAVSVKDEEAVRMSRWLSVRDGLFVGSSSAVNVVAAVRSAVKMREQWKALGKEGRPTVVTILCDSGVRHLSKFHNDGVLAKDYGIQLPQDSMDIDISDLLQG
ncbi:PALP-domain-containing protein [Microstroma glucosiphilum]|uniref:PALP-domain-containing protein n=1 Tax=Pseudomicrostroma glucosiphilum TaxID=1684307 RepID=A0A316UMA5_9BASI|nr:PALP-domain-containing protein [Pseudomicrostroma glucosiphilum]PWN24305.1 PALP-domain-containing protein [Pseudomicrostroma glucosiphilum]